MRTAIARLLYLVVLGCLGLLAKDATSQSDSLVTSVEWSSDGQYIASGTNDGAVTCWKVGSGQIAWKTHGSTKPILGIYFDSPRQAFVIIQWPVHVFLLDAKVGTVDLDLTIDLPERDGDKRSPLALSAFDDGSGTIALSGTIAPSIHLLNIRKFANSASARVIALGAGYHWLHPPMMGDTSGSSIVMWIKRPGGSDPDAGELSFDDPSAKPADFALCNLSNVVLGITRDGWLYRWDLADGEGRTAYRRHMETPEDPDAVHAQQFQHIAYVRCVNESTAITTGTTKKYGGIQTWKIVSGTLDDFRKAEPDKGFYDDEYSIAVSSDGQFAVTDGELSYTIWNLTNGKLIREARIHHANPGWEYQRVNSSFAKGTHLLVFPDGGLVYIGDLDRKSVKCLGTNCPALEITDVPVSTPNK